jgi:hypothetical protein
MTEQARNEAELAAWDVDVAPDEWVRHTEVVEITDCPVLEDESDGNQVLVSHGPCTSEVHHYGLDDQHETEIEYG